MDETVKEQRAQLDRINELSAARRAAADLARLRAVAARQRLEPRAEERVADGR